MSSKYKSINSEEYRRLYTELMQRLKSLFSQGYTLMTIVGVVWSLAATALGMFFDNNLLSFSENNIWLSLSLSMVIVVLFGLSTLITFPFSVKQLDDLRAVTSIGAYTRVFYEIPSICSEESDEKNDFYGWETLHCDAALSRTRFFNSEYIIAVLLSDMLSLSFCIIIACHIFAIGLIDVFIIFMIFAILYEGTLICLSVQIFRYSRTVIYIRSYMSEYLEMYIKEAIKIKRITPQQAEEYKDYLRMGANRDEILGRTLKLEMKRIRLERTKDRHPNGKNIEKIKEEKQYILQEFD